MSDKWIKPRLGDDLDRRIAVKINNEGYERWLMIVDDAGEVVNITKLDKNGNSLEEIIL